MPETIAAPAPAQKTTPAPVPQPSKPDAMVTPPSQEAANVFGDAFDAIDELDGKQPSPKKESPKETKRPESKPEESKKPESKSDDESSVEETKPVENGKHQEQKPVKAAELRTAYENLKEKIAKEYEPKLKRLPELEAKVKEFESRDESGTKATQERIASIERRNAELENHIRFVDYEKSKDYQEQYQKPYEDAWGAAIRELKGLTMKIEDPQTGEEKVREVTQADIAYFANLDPATRRTEINRLFPEDREEVKRHVNQISNLAEKSHAAREKAKVDADTHAKTQTEAQRLAQTQRAKLWKSTNEALATKYPKWFGKDEADAEGNALLDKGAALADLVFSPSDLTPDRVEQLPKMFRDAIESRQPFSPEALVKLHAIARNKIANHDRAIKRLTVANARIAELEASLKEFENSSPENVPAGKRSVTPAGMADAASELEALDRKWK